MSYNNFGQNPNYNFNPQNAYQVQQPPYAVPATAPVAQGAPAVQNKTEDNLFRAWIVLICAPFILSILTYLLLIVVMAFSDGEASTVTSSAFSGIIAGLSNIVGVLSSGCSIAALVIAIVAKVKFPKSKKINVIFWIQIAFTVIQILATIFICVIMAVACGSCLNDLQGCA